MATRRRVVSWLAAAPGLLPVGSPFAAQGQTPIRNSMTAAGDNGDYLLTYRAPAMAFGETLPVGNGLLGASVYGNVDRERLILNESSLWSGEPSDWNNPAARAILPEVRRLLFSGKFAEAELLCRKMQGPYTQSYLPMGELNLTFEHGAPSTPEIWSEAPGVTARAGLAGRSYLGYARELDLQTAIARVVYRFGGNEYRREVFASYPDRVLVIRLSSGKAGRLSFVAKLGSLLRHATLVEGDTLVLRGKAPRHAEPNYEDIDPPILYSEDEHGPGMTFECRVRATAEGGSVRVDHDGIHVRSADAVTLLISGATSFSGYDKSPSKSGRDPGALSRAALVAASRKSFSELREAHLRDHRELFDRVRFHVRDINRPPGNETERGSPKSNPALAFHYARYRLIASSRNGGQPCTLGGGMWNDSVRPPWSYNYTINENTQKQYAHVEAVNLAECAEPYIDFMQGLAVNGRKTARTNYGFRGWVAHHNTDLWRQSSPVGRFGQGDVAWANFMAGGIWLCENLYNHYAFNGDRKFLADRCYPILKGACEFALDWLVEDKGGHLVTAPSTSPEARYLLPNGESCGVSIATAADMSLVWELFKNTIEACRTLGVDSDFRQTLEGAQSRLRPLKTGSKGQLLEFYEEYPDRDPLHRHASHLLGLSWGSRISKRNTPKLFAAARTSWDLRGPEGSNLPDRQSMAGRFEDGELAYRILRNGGRPLAVMEMLLHSHLGELHLLPALPKAWPEGHLMGVKARGGFTLDIEWKEGRLAKTVIRAKLSGLCRVRAAVALSVKSSGKAVNTRQPEPLVIEFEAKAGEEYECIS